MAVFSRASEVLKLSRAFSVSGQPPQRSRLDRTCRRSFANQASDNSLSSSPSPGPSSIGHFGKLGPASKNTFRPPIPARGSEQAAAVDTVEESDGQKKDLFPGEVSTNVPEEVQLLRRLLLATPPPRPQSRKPTIAKTAYHDRTQVARSTESDTDLRAESLFQRLRAGDTRAVYRWMVPTGPAAASAVASGDKRVGTTLAEEEFQRYQIAAHLPPLVFSELLRCLDPFAVSEHRDYAQDIVISAGLAQFTPLRAQVDRYGIRVLYTALLRALVAVYEMRVDAAKQSSSSTGSQRQQPLLLNDYIVLMRCAGAASDIVAAKRFWNDMEHAGFVGWRQSGIYSEFVRARFLTEALYTQHDHARLRVRPINLHRQKLMLHPTRLHRLDRLRRALERYKVQRFGQNPHEPDYVEHLTRILRKTKPVRNILSKAAILGYAHDERLLAAVMIAFGRTGSIVALGNILNNYWNVRVVRDRATGSVTVSGGGEKYKPGSPMRPSAVLLDAVVQAYCCNGEVVCALQVVDYLARHYEIAIPDKVWFDLLNWTYVMTSKPASTEWKLAGFPSRVLKPATTELIWATMTAAPFNVQPGFAQYNILIKTLIQQSKFDSALTLMRQARPMYQAQLCEYEEALKALAEASRQRVAGHIMGLGAASRRLQSAANRKWHMWYCFQTWCWQLLKKARARALDDPFVVHTIPRIVDEFRPFLFASGGASSSGAVRYGIMTGTVQLREPHAHMYAKNFTAQQTVDLPSLRPHVMFQQWGLELNMTEKKTGSLSMEGLIVQETENGNKIISPEEDHWRERRLARNVLRRRTMWLRKPVFSTLDLRMLGSSTPREWLVREFA